MLARDGSFNFARIPVGRSVKARLYCEQAEAGSRKSCLPFLLLKDILKDLLKRGGAFHSRKGLLQTGLHGGSLSFMFATK